MSRGPIDVSLIAALVPVFIRGEAGGERFGYSKSTTTNAAASKTGPALRVASQSAPYGVAKLEKGTHLSCVLRLVWRALWCNAVHDEESTGPPEDWSKVITLFSAAPRHSWHSYAICSYPGSDTPYFLSKDCASFSVSPSLRIGKFRSLFDVIWL